MTEEKQDDIIHILKDEKILVAAWMLPNTGSLSDAQRRQAMDNFSRYTRAQGINATQVAHEIGTPKATTIGELMKGTFRVNADAYVRKLNLFVEQHARKRAASLGDKFVTTTKVAKDMLNTARLCRENSTMALCHGPTGIGKTACAMEIHRKYVGSVYIRIGHGYQHAKGLIQALSAKLDVRVAASHHARHHYTQLERVRNSLRNSHRLLIFDEAGKLIDSALELLRDIHDECGVPILLIATRDLYERIQKNAGPDLGQLYSRFDVVKNLTEGYDIFQGEGNRALHTVADIRAIYNEPPLRLSTDAAEYLRDVANMLGYGSLRKCRILLQNAARRARKRQGLANDDKVTVHAVDLEWIERRLKQESSEQSTIRDRLRMAAGMVSG